MAKKAKKAKARKTARKPARKPARQKAARKRPGRMPDALLAPIKGATAREIGGVQLDVASAGAARVKRMIYPPGFRWSTAMKPIVGTDRCMHAHVGFLARGEIHIEYADGCVVEFKAPQVVAIDPGSRRLGRRQGAGDPDRVRLRRRHRRAPRHAERASALTAGQFERISVLPNVDRSLMRSRMKCAVSARDTLLACRTAAGVRRRGSSSSADRR